MIKSLYLSATVLQIMAMLLTSGDLDNLFSENRDLTTEIMVKMLSSKGTLLSYTNTNTTGVVFSDNIKIYHGIEILDTTIRVMLNMWARIVGTYNSKLSVLSVYQ